MTDNWITHLIRSQCLNHEKNNKTFSYTRQWKRCSLEVPWSTFIYHCSVLSYGIVKYCPLRDLKLGAKLQRAGQRNCGILKMRWLLFSKIWYYQAKKKNTVSVATTSGFRTNRPNFPLGHKQFTSLSTLKFLRLQLLLCQGSHKPTLHKKLQRCLLNMQLPQLHSAEILSQLICEYQGI